jgi:RNA polymerase sigma factor (sigma-70 family)
MGAAEVLDRPNVWYGTIAGEKTLREVNNQERFERAMLPHLDAAYNLARWLTGRPQDAEDVVQDAYVRALTFFSGFRGEDGRAWLLAITRNVCYDWLRQRRRHAEMLGPADELDFAADTGPDPEAEQLRQADRQMVTDGISSLPVEYREVLVLRELEDLSYKQIASVTGMPMGTVMSRLARARKRLEAGLVSAAAGKKER